MRERYKHFLANGDAAASPPISMLLDPTLVSAGERNCICCIDEVNIRVKCRPKPL